MNKLATDIDSIVNMYESGLSSIEISKKLGVCKATILKRLNSAGVVMRSNKINIPISDIKRMYIDDLISENAIAAKFGVSRNVIRRLLNENGIHVRNQSESESVKWSKMDAKQRAKQVESAHKAMLAKPPEFHRDSAIKQAISKEASLAKACDNEIAFINGFKKLGYTVTPQKAFGPYNIDIAINGTAVEIHGNGCHPHTHTYYRKRVMDLLKGGWSVIYIKTVGKVHADIATQKVSRMIDLIESDKSGVCHYGMIRGSGELMASGCLDGDNLATVKASDGFFKAIK